MHSKHFQRLVLTLSVILATNAFAQNGAPSEIRRMLDALRDDSSQGATLNSNISALAARVRVNITKQFPPGTSREIIDPQVELVAGYLAALKIQPEDLNQPPKLTKQEAAFLKAQGGTEAAAKDLALRKRAARGIAPNAVAPIEDETEETLVEEQDPVTAATPEEASVAAEEQADPRPSKLKFFSRLLDASLKFLECPDLTDWVCLESQPTIEPKAKMRKGDPRLGAPVFAGQSLDMEWYFNEAWDNKGRGRMIPANSPAAGHISAVVSANTRTGEQAAQPLARWQFDQRADGAQVAGPQAQPYVPREALERLLDPKRFSALSFAIYGINHVQPGQTLNGVLNKIVGFFNERGRESVRGVVDVALAPRRVNPRVDGSGKWLLSYVAPDSLAGWFFAPPTPEDRINFNGANFQYDGTAELMRQLNWPEDRRRWPRTEEASRVRIEWSPNNIMHNKFIVFDSVQTGRPEVVWTGTANFSDHCLGEETNSNMSLVIRNPFIAQTFKTQFEHMYGFTALPVASDKVRFQRPTAPSVGSFHKKKLPVSNRLFTFGDGTMLRVHFAPTDDGEHRSVLPMIHSANKGDVLRISMFGNSGYEYIRALQLAEARGVFIQIVVDGQQGAGKFSWLNDVSGNLLESPNPYEATLHRKFPELAFPRDQAGRVFRRMEIRSSGFDGKNHYKAGSLTRAPKVPGQPGIVDTFIVGSQNWSTGGNDANDENMISIQNKRVGLKIGRQFNLEFEHLWQASRPRQFRPLVAQQAAPRR